MFAEDSSIHTVFVGGCLHKEHLLHIEYPIPIRVMLSLLAVPNDIVTQK